MVPVYYGKQLRVLLQPFRCSFYTLLSLSRKKKKEREKEVKEIGLCSTPGLHAGVGVLTATLSACFKHSLKVLIMEQLGIIIFYQTVKVQAGAE